MLTSPGNFWIEWRLFQCWFDQGTTSLWAAVDEGLRCVEAVGIGGRLATGMFYNIKIYIVKKFEITFIFLPFNDIQYLITSEIEEYFVSLKYMITAIFI